MENSSEKTITGWESKDPVVVHAKFNNGHTSEYQCKALDLAYLCQLLERDVGAGLLHHYEVFKNGVIRDKYFFQFTEKYPNWKS